MRIMIMLLLVTLCSCEAHHELTTCRGSFAAANPGKWQAAAEDLKP